MKMPAVITGLFLFSITLSGQLNQVLVKENPYKAGEKLVYSVKFGPITGGTASLILKQTSYNNKQVFHSVAQGKTVGLTEVLYSVKDIFESYFDINNGLPYKSVRDIKEGNYKRHQEAFFDHAKRTAYSQREDSTIVVPPDILDMVSLIYYIRRIDYVHLKPGVVIKSVTLFDDEIFPFDIRYKGKEEVKTKYGKIRCHRFDPVVEKGRMFKSEDDMQIWLSDDKNVIPIRVRFNLLVGSLRMDLDEYSGLKYPIVFN